MINSILKRRFLLPLILSTLCSVMAFGQRSMTEVAEGKIEGVVDDGVAIYRGVPFAAPPVGDLRWKAPQKLSSWSGTKDCSTFSASPMQSEPNAFRMWSVEFMAPKEPLDEDCLYLNVWTTAANKEERKPVFVWVYGGAFTSGSGACPIYDGAHMAKEGVVYVTINYRLGVFGFMAHPELSAEADYGTSGNYGLLDQVAALQWIQENIAAFGGDPNNVTVAGQSAGSFAVNSLIASPLAKGLFHKAITQSGGILGSRQLSPLKEAEDRGTKLMTELGAEDLADLRMKSAKEVLEASLLPGTGRFGPIEDKYMIPDQLRERFKNGEQNDVPIITGWVTGDASYANSEMTLDKYEAFVNEQLGDKTSRFLELFPAKNDEDAKRNIARARLLQYTGITAHLMGKYNKSPTYVYEFTHVPTDKPDFPNYGAFHSAELGYALGTLHMWDRPWVDRDYKMQYHMHGYWVNFAKHGTPNSDNLPNWPAYDMDQAVIMELAEEPVAHPQMLKAKLEFIEGLD